MSSPAETLGSRVRTPLKARMFVCVYSVFMLSCVVLPCDRADHPSKEPYLLSIRSTVADEFSWETDQRALYEMYVDEEEYVNKVQ
jgi:hypothetical protein